MEEGGKRKLREAACLPLEGKGREKGEGQVLIVADGADMRCCVRNV